MSVFNQNNKTGIESQKLFFGEPPSVARYDQQRFPQFMNLYLKMRGNFWVPTEVTLSQDIKDYRNLSPLEQRIFTRVLQRQILLDSVQGRAPALAFLPPCSSPELESAIVKWTEQEIVHSESYSHIIKNIYSNPSEVFDTILEIEEIVDCAKDISVYYDELIRHNALMLSGDPSYNLYEHKKALWISMQTVNALEGIRFYASFAVSWNFAEQKKMEGNAKIIKLINDDEAIHMSLTHQILKTLLTSDDDFKQVEKETRDQCTKMFIDVIEQEKIWVDYLFKDGSMIGLNDVILKQYVEWMGTRRMKARDLESPYKNTPNPLPWTTKWIAGGDVQVAPQETEITQYIIGGIDMDIDENTFKDFEL